VRPTSAAPPDILRKSAPQSLSATLQNYELRFSLFLQNNFAKFSIKKKEEMKHRKTLLLYIFVLIASCKIQEAVALFSNAHRRSSIAFTKLNAALSSLGLSSSNKLCTSDTKDPLLSINSLQNDSISTINDPSIKCKYSIAKNFGNNRKLTSDQSSFFRSKIHFHACPCRGS
jgi:hypothetical protein